jgi:hypothetical protein
VEFEKKIGVQSTDTGKKLTCRKSLFEKHNRQQRENRYGGPLSGEKSMPIKPVVKTDRSEVKSPVSLPRNLGVSSRSEEED